MRKKFYRKKETILRLWLIAVSLMVLLTLSEFSSAPSEVKAKSTGIYISTDKSVYEVGEAIDAYIVFSGSPAVASATFSVQFSPELHVSDVASNFTTSMQSDHVAFSYVSKNGEPENLSDIGTISFSGANSPGTYSISVFDSTVVRDLDDIYDVAEGSLTIEVVEKSSHETGDTEDPGEDEPTTEVPATEITAEPTSKVSTTTPTTKPEKITVIKTPMKMRDCADQPVQFADVALSSEKIPSGFVTEKFMVKNTKVYGYSSKEEKLQLFVLKNAEGKIDLFYYDEKAECFLPYVRKMIGQKPWHFVDISELETKYSGFFKKTQVKLHNSLMPALQVQSQSFVNLDYFWQAFSTWQQKKPLPRLRKEDYWSAHYALMQLKAPDGTKLEVFYNLETEQIMPMSELFYPVAGSFLDTSNLQRKTKPPQTKAFKLSAWGFSFVPKIWHYLVGIGLFLLVLFILLIVLLKNHKNKTVRPFYHEPDFSAVKDYEDLEALLPEADKAADTEKKQDN